jgi:primosomal protein N' (replication factor Y)
MYFIEVVLPLSLSQTFTYQVNEAEFYFLKPGFRVAVPFGKNKIYTALVLDVHQNKPEKYDAKEIHQILDETPMVTQTQINHWLWIASYYMCAIGDVYRSAIPSALLLESETVITQKSTDFVLESSLSDDEFLVYQALQQQSSLKIQDVVGILNRKNVLPVIKQLMDKNILFIEEEVQENYKPKLVKYIRLNPDFNSSEGLNQLLQLLKNAQKQREIVMSYFQLMATEKGKPIAVKQLLEKSGTTAVVKALIDKNIFEEYQIQHDRVSFENDYKSNELVLSDAQNKALTSIQHQFENHEVTLLHGVTSSGKTEIYIKLIEQFLLYDKQILYLLPEIALTTQLVTRLTAHFGNLVTVVAKIRKSTNYYWSTFGFFFDFP